MRVARICKEPESLPLTVSMKDKIYANPAKAKNVINHLVLIVKKTEFNLRLIIFRTSKIAIFNTFEMVKN